MTDVKPSRSYSSPARERQAAGTRAAVLAAARELFVEQGYGATTVDQIAARAGVSKPTVFSAVGSKQTVLSVVRDVAMAGDDEAVAVSDRPEQAYRVTILNSGAVNAFALPTGQLYVTRGLIALASDTSELSSVLSHEMAHVLAKHASIREDQARQAAVVTRVVTDMSNDPDLTALALAKTKLTMASFSRQQEFEADGIGVGIAARAGYDPYGAQRFLT